MRTAIILLLLLAAAASVGTFFPQRPISVASVQRYVTQHPGWSRIADRMGLFDVYGAWWFMAIYILLLVSLVGCLLPRYRAFARMLRARPRVSSALERQQHYTAGTVAVTPERALEGAARILRGRRFRHVRGETTISAEKGHAREFGSLVFHTAFLVLLVGMSVGKLWGFTGQVAIVEGDRFIDTHVAYDSITEGRLFNEKHREFSLAVKSFDVGWFPNGVPKQFETHATLRDSGGVMRDVDISVNHPFTYKGVRMYQLGWGWAPVLKLTQNGRTLYDGATIFLQRRGWHGVMKITTSQPQQTGFEMLFLTDPVLDAAGNAHDASPEPRSPVIVFQQYLGDLGLVVPQSVFELDPTSLTPGEKAGLRLGGAADLPNGMRLEFTGLKQYTVLEVASNPGAPILLVAAILILVGLIPALYSSRRRVWVRAVPSGEAARLEIAGHALQRKAAFESEFQSLLRELDRDLATVASSSAVPSSATSEKPTEPTEAVRNG